MLYDEKIETLISAALADGILTEKEKQVLFRRAQAQGIDLDEFEMVLDARLVELEKEKVKAKIKEFAPKSTIDGNIRKCPVCGAMLPVLGGVCPKCGYELYGVEANLTSQKMADKIEQVSAEWDKKLENINGNTIWDDDKKWECQKGKEQALARAIISIPIPNTKSDLFEFITVTQAAFLSPSTSFFTAEAYHTKYQEAIIKVKNLPMKDQIFSTIIRNDGDVQTLYKTIHKKQAKVGAIKPSNKMALRAVLGIVIFLLLDIICLACLGAL